MVPARSLLIALAVPVLVFAALLAASFAAAGVERDVYRDRAREAVAAGALARPMQYKPLDCLILSMLALEPLEGRARAALSPRIPLDDRPPPHVERLPQDKMCRNLAITLSDPATPSGYYHRYLHGHWVVAAALLPFMSFDAATRGLFWLYVAALLAVSLVALIRLVSRHGGARDAAFTALAFGALGLTGQQAFGGSIAFILSDLTAASFLAYCYFRPPGLQRNGEWLAVSGLLGALTAAFEFLNGALPIAVALLIAVVALGEGGWTRERTRRLIGGLACFAVGFAGLFLLKALAVGIVWGWSEIGSAGGRLSGWMTHDNWSTAPANERMLADRGLSSDDFRASRPHAFIFAMAKMAMMSDVIGYGSRAIGFIIVVIGPLLFLPAAALTFFAHERARSAAFLLALGCILGWHLLFVSHTIVHANFMQRTLGWTSAMAGASLAWALATRRARLASHSR